MDGYWRDLREFLAALEERDLLFRIKERVNKDTELMPIVRWQFRGLDEKQRKGFLFENVTDAKGKDYNVPVAVSVLGASRDVYAVAMNCKPEEIGERWMRAWTHLVPPREVSTGPCKEEIHIGQNLLAHGGLGEFPIPISTPGFDPAPFTSSSFWVTKDPDTGVYNVGCYRGMVKGPARLGNGAEPMQHISITLAKYRAMQRPMPAAVVLGAVPAIGIVSVTKVPYEQDEYDVAGGIAGGPIEVVPCETSDLLVPATAELVIEGEVPPDILEPEAPFGEYPGYMGLRIQNPIFNVKCITHRKSPIYHAYISQHAPNEGSKMGQISNEVTYYKFLKYDCNIPTVTRVVFHECAVAQLVVIQLAPTAPTQPWQALNCAVGYHAGTGKIIIAVNEDIDPADLESVFWAMSYRMQPHLDTRVVVGKGSFLDPSAAPPGSPTEQLKYPMPTGTSALLINATRKWDYTPVALPARSYMERAKEMWEKMGLPPLAPKVPWHGYKLGPGGWTKEWEEDAEAAVRGDYYLTGERLAKEQTTIS